MAEPLKLFFDAPRIRAIAGELKRAYPTLRADRFVSACLDGLDTLSLTGRGWRIAKVMHDHLPRPFPRAAGILIDSLGPEHAGTDSFGMAPFRYLPHVFFVQKHGLEDFEPAMRLQYEITKRFTAESSIRAFLVRYPEATYARLQDWAQDNSVHVRRLVSEGTRPRLPWAPRLRAFQENPRPVIALLERLRDDPERYVQRSVANNLNDIAKDHPELAVAVCRRWWDEAQPGRRWIVRHALRSLVKKGNRSALEIMGVARTPQVEVSPARFAANSIAIGETLRFSFTVASTCRSPQQLLVDYVVHFVKANGATSPKVFKLRQVMLAGAGLADLSSSISFKILTTRRPYPGQHRIDALINGIRYPLGTCEVRPAKPRGGAASRRRARPRPRQRS